MWRAASMTLAAAALAIAGAIVLFASGPVELTDDAFPDRTGIGIALPDAKYAIEQRVTEFWDDQHTPKTTTTLYDNAELRVDNHRPNGTIETRDLFYPPTADGQSNSGIPNGSNIPIGARQLKAHATIDTDGVTYLTDIAYYPDGKKQRSGMLRADKSYQIITYFEDGMHVRMNELVGAKGEPLFQSILRLDGSVQQMARQNEQSFDVTTYDEQSRAIKTSAKAKYWTRETTYHADGKTVKTDFLMELYKTTASYFGENGLLTQKREFDSWRMTATFYQDGVPAYRQTWRLLNKEAVKPEQVRNYSLIEAAVLNADGKASWRVTFNWETGLPAMIEIGMDKASHDLVSPVTRKWYGKEGYLELMLVKQGEYGPEISRQQYTPAEGILPDAIPAYLKEPVPFEVPPKPVPPQPPPMF